MVDAAWVRRIQPIAVRDVLRYLVACLELPPEVNRSFDIGGPDVVTYEEMMQSYAEVAGPAPAADRAGAGALAEGVRPLGRRRHPGAARDRRPAGGIPGQRGGGRRPRHRRVHPRPGRGPAAARRGHSPRNATGPRGRRRDLVVVGRVAGRAVGPAAERPRLGRRLALRRRADESSYGPPATSSGRSSRGSAARTAGTPGRWPGRYAAGWTGSSGGVGPARGRRDPRRCEWATSSTGGGSRRSSAARCCGCAPR